MARRSEGQLFVGRLSKNTRTRDLEEIFQLYGRLARCDIKYGRLGAEMAYAFLDYEDRRDAEDAIKYENGRDICGSSIIVEWAKGNPRRPMQQGNDECYKCHRPGHWARDCPDDRHGRRRSQSPRRRRSRSRDRRRRTRSRSRSLDRKRTSHSRSYSKSPSRRSRLSQSRSRSRENGDDR